MVKEKNVLRDYKAYKNRRIRPDSEEANKKPQKRVDSSKNMRATI